MLRRLVKDESGIALGLAVILVVLIGVMGAGLLTFASSNLNSVVEVNQGQQAFDTSDAGVQAAKRQLLSDAVPEHYDNSSDCADNSSWAYRTKQNGTCQNNQKTLTFDGKTTKVSIQYLPSATVPVASAHPDQNEAPEIPAADGKLDSGCRYFKITSYGESGSAKRGVETIFCASKLDLPTAYYTPKNIDFRGTVNISGISFFAKGNITKNGNVTVDSASPALYRDWDTNQFDPPTNYNTRGRRSGTTPITSAGLGAEGTIDDFGAGRKGVYDFDSTTTPKFCRKPASAGSSAPCSTSVTTADVNPANTISYPFDPSAEVDLDFMKEEAQLQGNYYDTNKDIDMTSSGTKAQYPANSTDQTVFYINGQGRNVAYNIPASYNARGTIVVENGNIAMNGNVAFKGVMVIDNGGNANLGKYITTGTPELDGFVIADGDMTIRGDAAPLTVSEDFTTRPGFYSVKLWSWRELYS